MHLYLARSQSMTSLTTFRLRRHLTGLGLGALFAVTTAMAQQAPITQPGTTGIDTSGDVQKERAACMSGRTQQDQATCLREANNAAAEKRRGRLDNQGGQFDANARQRCEVLTGEDRVACEARVVGYGSASGSVAGGGLIREVETVVVPADAGTVRIQPQTAAPVLLIEQK
jgi:hypothetical protein